MNSNLRQAVKNIDSRLFNGNLRKLNRIRCKYQSYWYGKPYEKRMLNNFTSKIDIIFNQNKKSLLAKLFDNYGAAKCHCQGEEDVCALKGCYYNIYDLLFLLHRNKVKILLECGIGTKNKSIPCNMSGLNSTPGGSLHAWRAYFPNAQIIGLDIDPDVMFTEDRISTYVCDQTSKLSINSFIKQANLKPNTVDIIVDDGMHDFVANITLFENTKHLLRDNGIYIIEDFFIINKEQQQFIDYFSNLTSYYVRFFKFAARYLIVITKHN